MIDDHSNWDQFGSNRSINQSTLTWKLFQMNWKEKNISEVEISQSFFFANNFIGIFHHDGDNDDDDDDE